MQSLFCRACFSSIRIKIPVRASGSQSKSDSPLKKLLDEATSFGEAEPSHPELQWATQPYAARPHQVEQEKVDPRETSVVLFPGQGAQKVGMGLKLKDVPAAMELYELASSVVGWNVWKVCTEGPEKELARRCQTAVMVTSLAVLERAQEERPATLEKARAAAGFSLGEITALVWAGALPLEQALRLVEIRATAMEAASADRPGGMLTVWMTPDAKLSQCMNNAKEYAIEKGVDSPVCQIANYLFPGCKVLAGDEEAIKYIAKHGNQFGIRRSARVAVSGAFHTPLMASAAEAVKEALRFCTIKEPSVKVYSCVDGNPYSNVRDIRKGLVKLTTAPVRWEQILHALYARPRDHGLPLTLALGPGGTLRSTLKLVNARAWDTCIQIDA